MVRPRVLLLNSNSQPDVSFDNCTKRYKNASVLSPGTFLLCIAYAPFQSFWEWSSRIQVKVFRQLCPFCLLVSRRCLRLFNYDNACNLSKSIILRTPWVLSETRLCCDRFHYRSHTCPSVFDPDSFRTLDEHRTSGAEATNARWATSRSHIRFLDGSNLIPFIIAKSIFINLRAHCKEKLNVWDVEDTDIAEFGRRVLPWKCIRCVKNQGICM